MAAPMDKKIINGQVGEYKSVAINEIISTERDGLSDEIINAIDPKFLEEPTDLIYEHIFPYLRVPNLTTEMGSYILVAVDVPRVSTKNFFFKQIVITVMVMVHQDLMYMGGETNRTRCDYIAERIVKILNGNKSFTGERLEYVSDTEGIVLNTYHTRTMRFSADDTNDLPCENNL